MTNFTRITGSAAAGGIAVLDEAGKILWLDNAASVAQWNGASRPLDTEKVRADIVMCGTNTNGVAIASGGTVSYLNCLGQKDARWKSTQDLGHDIVAITGDNASGYTVAANVGKGVQIFQLSSADSKSEWKLLGAPLPFDVKVIAGDNKGGVLIAGGDNGAELARSSSDCCSWNALPPAPFEVKLITGNATNGFVVYGEGQLYGLDPKWNWVPLPRLNFPIVAMSGNLKDGIVALVGKGDVIAYCADVSKTAWNISMIQ